jgi:hypothetical protein
MFSNRKKVKEQIEKCCSELEQKAISLIDKYGPMIRDEIFSHKKQSLPCGGSYPDAKKDCNGDSEEYLVMKGFIERHPEYETQNSNFVKDWYGI